MAARTVGLVTARGPMTTPYEAGYPAMNSKHSKFGPVDLVVVRGHLQRILWGRRVTYGGAV